MNYKDLPLYEREKIEQYNTCLDAIESIKEALYTLAGTKEYAVMELTESLLRYTRQVERIKFCLRDDGYRNEDIENLANQYLLQTLTAHKN